MTEGNRMRSNDMTDRKETKEVFKLTDLLYAKGEPVKRFSTPHEWLSIQTVKFSDFGRSNAQEDA